MRKRSEVANNKRLSVKEKSESNVDRWESNKNKDSEVHNPKYLITESNKPMDKISIDDVDIKELTITWGGELYNPKPGSYTTMAVGPFSIVVNVRKGDDINELFRVIHKKLSECAGKVYCDKLKEFTERVQRTGK